MGILRLKQSVPTRTTLGAYIPKNRHFITVCGFCLRQFGWWVRALLGIC